MRKPYIHSWAKRMKALVIVIMIIVLAALGYLGFRKPSSKQEDESPLISIVYLLQTPRQMSEESIRNHASEAFGVDFEPDNEDATELVIELPSPPFNGVPKGKGASYMLKINDNMYIVHNFAMPYMEDPAGFAQSIADERLHSAITKHSAWISVDAMGDFKDATSKAQAYRDIAKMIAQLAGADCLAIYCPELERCNEYDEIILETLRSGDPLGLFEEPTFAPVISVYGEDPRMIRAVAEARRRWPEFVAAFRNNLDREAPFMVKAEFKEGDKAEFMWISVTQINDETIHGVLENVPIELTNVKQGQKVVVPISTLNDWLYAKNGESVGDFTINVIQEIQGN